MKTQTKLSSSNASITHEVPSCDSPFPVASRRTKRDRFRITRALQQCFGFLPAVGEEAGS
jgi:hypothetical protein